MKVLASRGVFALMAAIAVCTPAPARVEVVAPKVADLTATEAIAAMESGDLTAVRYATALLARAHSMSFLNTIISQDSGAVLAAARSADSLHRSGGPLGLLHGLPILIKDNINTTELPTSGGTPSLAGNTPAADAELVVRLLEAGAILYGKSNMHELAFGITSNNTAFGPVRNPYDPTKIPGGSSGGNGAAVAARIVAASIGSDTAGSTRIPAALCGIVGFRPTVGRYPGSGAGKTQIVPISHTQDTAGPMARAVADVALLDAVITENDPEIEPAILDGLRLGVPRGTFYSLTGADPGIDPEVSAIVEAVLEVLEAHGVVLVEVDIPDLIDLSDAVGFPVALFEPFNIDLPAYLSANAPGVSLEDLIEQIASPDVKFAYETLAPEVSLEAYEAALAARVVLQAAYADYFADNAVEAVIFPTTLLPARPIGQDETVELNGEQVPTLTTYLHNTFPAGNAGIPGLSIPAGLTLDDLPVGIELDGPEGSDRRLLEIGLAVEAVLGPLPAPPQARPSGGGRLIPNKLGRR